MNLPLNRSVGAFRSESNANEFGRMLRSEGIPYKMTRVAKKFTDVSVASKNYLRAWTIRESREWFAEKTHD